MSDIDAATVQETGKEAAGKAGFEIHYDPVGEAKISGDKAVVNLQLNIPSLERAHRINDGGEKEQAIKSSEPETPKPSAALSSSSGKRDRADAAYEGLFKKRGLEKTVAHFSPSGPRVGGRRDHRSAFAKSPLDRRRRQMLQLRKSFDDIKRHMTKDVKVENLSKAKQTQIVESHLQQGHKETPLGTIEQAVKKVGMTASYNPWQKWEGALFPGSYTSAPRPRAT